MSKERREWSEEELLVVFRLYCRTPFGRLHQRNPEIIQLAELIGRTSSAVGMKACNFASLDPEQKKRGVKALGNVSKADRELWEAFMDDSENVAHKSEMAYSTLIGQNSDDYAPELGLFERNKLNKPSMKKRKLGAFPQTPHESTEKDIVVKTRLVQSFFRAAILTSYGNRCAITGLAIPELLNASHIIPWSVEEKRRADPRNGICLNVFHDRAFDRGLISFDENLLVIVSSTINKTVDCEMHRSQLIEICGRPLRLPERFLPDRAAIEYHREYAFRT